MGEREPFFTAEDAALLASVADWYGTGPKYPVEFEQGRQRIAGALRRALVALAKPPFPIEAHHD